MIEKIKQITVDLIGELYQKGIAAESITVNQTPPEFEGDYTVVTFPVAKAAGQRPDVVANTLGEAFKKRLNEIESFNVVKGFLNLKFSNSYWINFLQQHYNLNNYGLQPSNNRKVMVEYCGPNTNKPLHLGHVRNILIGYSVAEILKAAGNEVIKVNIYNDRGIHICKSMLAYKKFGHGETPETNGIKGDHLVGDYYVKYEQKLKKQVNELVAQGLPEEEAKRKAPLAQEVQEMLLKWEQGDIETRNLWSMMNSWVYKGFEETFRQIGCDFKKHYHESETFLLGKEVVEEGLEKKVFFKKDDGSVWVDLTADGLDQKLLLRADGTSVYITQDLGTADLRYKDFGAEQMIYTVASEQDYHFKVLKLICEKLGRPYAKGIYHLSYGMVDLPSGRMKSREGTVVDADDLVKEMEDTAALHSQELGKIDQFEGEEKKKLYHQLGLGALKFYILRVDPRKRMIFNPEESIDFHGFTGTFIQYTHARISSVLRKAGEQKIDYTQPDNYSNLQPLEREIIQHLSFYPDIIKEAATNYDPASLANYLYKLAKTFNSFYADLSILNAENNEEKLFRLKLSLFVTTIIKNGMLLLGIEVPDKM